MMDERCSIMKKRRRSKLCHCLCLCQRKREFLRVVLLRKVFYAWARLVKAKVWKTLVKVVMEVIGMVVWQMSAL